MQPPKITPHKILAVANQKGGAGKSTTAGNLAYWLGQYYSVAFVDADGQASASPWMQVLKIPSFQLNNPEQLFESLPKLAQQYHVVVVDAPGNAGETTKSILSRCDLVAIPNRPSQFDLRSSGTIVQFVRHVRELRGGMPKALMFINAAKGQRSVLLREAREVLAECPLTLAKTIIYDRTCITDAPGQQTVVFSMPGEQAKAAAVAYEALFQEMLEELSNG